jgi:putative FmdB family regulatory protein
MIYEYQCEKCGIKFDRSQSMNDAPLTECPECCGSVHRLISGGTGFLVNRGSWGGYETKKQDCSFAGTGVTCCGKDTRCGDSHCGS